MLGIKSGNVSLYTTALSHSSVKENADENNERLEYLGDAVLSSIVADYLFKKYVLPVSEDAAAKKILKRYKERMEKEISVVR